MSDNECKKGAGSGLFFLGVFIALGLIGAGYFIGNTLYKSRVAVNTATVKGLAEREVKSDLALWNVSFTMESDNLESAYAAANSKKQITRQFFLDNGFEQSEMSFSNSVYIQEYRDEGVLKDKKYQVTTYADIRTKNVDKVESMKQKMGDLIAKGVAISNNSPSYLFTSLNEIKPDMLKEATQNARLAAKQFAEDAGAKVGTIQSAHQGSFSISSMDGNDNYGITDQTSLHKKVRVVTTISFYLED